MRFKYVALLFVFTAYSGCGNSEKKRTESSIQEAPARNESNPAEGCALKVRQSVLNLEKLNLSEKEFQNLEVGEAKLVRKGTHKIGGQIDVYEVVSKLMGGTGIHEILVAPSNCRILKIDFTFEE